jgi:hypothetical protein
MKKKGAKGRQFKRSKNFNKKSNDRISKSTNNKIKQNLPRTKSSKPTSDIIRSWQKP